MTIKHTHQSDAAKAVRAIFGLKSPDFHLLSQTAKTSKTDKRRPIHSRALYMQPAQDAWRMVKAILARQYPWPGYWARYQLELFYQDWPDLCGGSSGGCRAGCLKESGHLIYDSAQRAMLNRTLLWYLEPSLFHRRLWEEIQIHTREAHRKQLEPAIRLDGTQDLGLALRYADRCAGVRFYDYTKILDRYLAWLGGHRFENWHLTFSRSEENWQEARAILARGGNAAIVFRDRLPLSYCGWTVHDATAGDDRYNDPPATVPGLLPLGRMKRDRTGMVLDHPFAIGVHTDSPDENIWTLPA